MSHPFSHDHVEFNKGHPSDFHNLDYKLIIKKIQRIRWTTISQHTRKVQAVVIRHRNSIDFQIIVSIFHVFWRGDILSFFSHEIFLTSDHPESYVSKQQTLRGIQKQIQEKSTNKKYLKIQQTKKIIQKIFSFFKKSTKSGKTL